MRFDLCNSIYLGTQVYRFKLISPEGCNLCVISEQLRGRVRRSVRFPDVRRGL